MQAWDKLDATGKEKMRLRELKNGRLAMIGVASFLSAHFIAGSVPCLPPGF
jgi:Chlorophyll A-B binding protein